MGPEVWFMWKIFAKVEGCDDGARFLTPMADPSKYEHAFDFLFESANEAVDGLEKHGVKGIAEEENWVLVKVKLEPMMQVGE